MEGRCNRQQLKSTEMGTARQAASVNPGEEALHTACVVSVAEKSRAQPLLLAAGLQIKKRQLHNGQQKCRGASPEQRPSKTNRPPSIHIHQADHIPSRAGPAMSKLNISTNWTTTQAVSRAVSFVEFTMAFSTVLRLTKLWSLALLPPRSVALHRPSSSMTGTQPQRRNYCNACKQSNDQW